jgi:signal peptidase I
MNGGEPAPWPLAPDRQPDGAGYGPVQAAQGRPGGGEAASEYGAYGEVPTAKAASFPHANVVAPVVVAAPAEEVRRSGGGWGAALREVAETVILTLVIFLMVRAVVENYKVEGSSMEPNLETGQYLIVNKVQYGLVQAERGDIIVFRAPRTPDKNFVKRIIGLPGEKVELRQGQVYINDKLLYEPYIDARFGYSWGPAVVGADELFVLGDNRNNSSDSHSWGMLPRENVIGKAWVCYWPPRNWGFLPHYVFALR